jgi:cardiolipin synthase
VRTAGRAAYDELLGAGIEIHEYCPTMLHAKTLTVDGAWASVGSVNFDNRSFQLHDEVTLCVQDDRFAGLLHDVFEQDLERSERIDPEEWSRRAPTQRARERLTKYARREL